ncbi:MAG: hypothetical protein ACYTHK_08260 [Planctomycetota bacterium]|jgi:hypothetical protein
MALDLEQAVVDRDSKGAQARENEARCPISYGPRPLRVMKGALLLLLLAACENDSIDADPAWLQDKAWDDGKAMVSVYKGRIKWYGQWREAEVRHYLVREYLHPRQLVKQEPPGSKSLPVLKANILISFNTGTYPYRQMCSLFFHRKSGELIKAVGSSQEGCGTSMQRWDLNGVLHYDTYWEGEARGERALSKAGNAFFEEELPVIAGLLRDQQVRILPSLVRSSVRKQPDVEAKLVRDGRDVRVGKRIYSYDEDGFLVKWSVPGREEFRRVSSRRFYYWEFNRNGDEKLLEAK